jgi:hypothetical protein
MTSQENPAILLKLGEGASAYLTRRLGTDAARILEDALNMQGRAYAYETQQNWHGRQEKTVKIVAPQLRISLRAVKPADGGEYLYVAAAEPISKQDTYEAWAHPLTAPVIILRPDEAAITRCGVCTRPLPSGAGDVEKCPSCLHQYPGDTAIVKLDTQPTPIRVQCDVAALIPLDQDEQAQPQEFGIAFHPNAKEKLCKLPQQDQTTINQHIAATMRNCNYDRLRLRSGAYIIITTPNEKPPQPRPIKELNQILRRTGVGYILDQYELRLAQTLAAKERQQRRPSNDY